MANDIVIKQGVTFAQQLKYCQPVLTVKPITGATKSGQAVLTVPSHGLAVDWLVWVVGVAGMTKINHRSDQLKRVSDAYRAYYVDANTIRLDLDTTRFSDYVSDGELLYLPPVDLTGYTARMKVKQPDIEGTVVVELTTENGGITLNANGEILVTIAAAATELFDFEAGVYDLEIVSASGVVTRVVSGAVLLDREVTT
jgi:hypothetical protein